MRRENLTAEEVAAACEAINAAGERPSVEAVREACGGGSYTTISRLIKQWQASDEAKPGETRADGETVSEAMRALQDPLARILGEAYQRGVDAERSASAGTLEALRAENRVLNQELREAEEEIIRLEIVRTDLKSALGERADKVEGSARKKAAASPEAKKARAAKARAEAGKEKAAAGTASKPEAAKKGTGGKGGGSVSSKPKGGAAKASKAEAAASMPVPTAGEMLGQGGPWGVGGGGAAG